MNWFLEHIGWVRFVSGVLSATVLTLFWKTSGATSTFWLALALSILALVIDTSDYYVVGKARLQLLKERMVENAAAVEALAPLLRSASSVCEHRDHLNLDPDIMAIELKVVPGRVIATLNELVRWSQPLAPRLERSLEEIKADELRDRDNAFNVAVTLLQAAKMLAESRGADLTATRATCKDVRRALIARLLTFAPLMPPSDFVRALRRHASPASLFDVVADHAEELPTDQPDGEWARQLLKFALQSAGKAPSPEPPPAAT